MHHRPTAAITAAFTATLALLLAGATVEAHNITAILNKFPEFSTFNHYLTVTHLAGEINNRQTITVCAVNNAGMSDLSRKHLSVHSMKNVLSLHVLLDYFGAKKLHQINNGTALAATLFQATGTATGASGIVNITDLRGGKVGFGSEESGTTDATFVKSLREVPYNISVIQISSVLLLPSSEAEAAAEAPSPEPAAVNITSIMSAHGCRYFAEALIASDAMNTYADDVDGGLSVFCPNDDAFKRFLPKYRNLTIVGKQSLLEYHGVPVYQSISMLKSSNGVMNTLATDGGSKYDFTVQNDGDDVTIKTTIVTAKIVGTLIDQQPLVIFTVDKVLLPKELFQGAVSPAPEVDAPAAESPRSSRKKKKLMSPPAPVSTESPAESPEDSVADEDADSSNGGEIKGFSGLVLCVWVFGLLV